MKRGLSICAILSLLALPAITLAETHDHGAMQMKDQAGDHGAMSMTRTKTMMLGEETIDGVKGMAHLNDVGAMMAQMGQKENFHFMIMFSDAKTGEAVTSGTVAVKIVDPKTGKAGEAIPLMGMGEGAGSHFGADVTLPAKGDYQFQVGSKLADGKKRQFTFKYSYK
jgi:hypothetical protein